LSRFASGRASCAKLDARGRRLLRPVAAPGKFQSADVKPQSPARRSIERHDIYPFTIPVAHRFRCPVLRLRLRLPQRPEYPPHVGRLQHAGDAGAVYRRDRSSALPRTARRALSLDVQLQHGRAAARRRLPGRRIRSQPTHCSAASARRPSALLDGDPSTPNMQIPPLPSKLPQQLKSIDDIPTPAPTPAIPIPQSPAPQRKPIVGPTAFGNQLIYPQRY